MTTPFRRPVALARVRAFAALIRPYCTRLEIAGSIRRGKPEVKDAELVAIPGAGLLSFLDALVEQGRIQKAEYGESRSHRWGPKYRGLIWQGLRVEIFLTDAASWGYIYWLRTGPGDGNQTLVTLLGTHKAPIRVREGQVWASRNWTYNAKKKQWNGEDERQVQVPDEATWFALIGVAFIPPGKRTDDLYGRLIKHRHDHQWGDPTPHIIRPMTTQRLLMDVDVIPAGEAAKVVETAPRIHPVVISRWTPDLEAAYTAQVVAESVARMRQRSAEMRRKAEGWTGSHYWKVADEMDAAIKRLGRSA
jgi:hypothetical protein